MVRTSSTINNIYETNLEVFTFKSPPPKNKTKNTQPNFNDICSNWLKTQVA